MFIPSLAGGRAWSISSFLSMRAPSRFPFSLSSRAHLVSKFSLDVRQATRTEYGPTDREEAVLVPTPQPLNRAERRPINMRDFKMHGLPAWDCHIREHQPLPTKPSGLLRWPRYWGLTEIAQPDSIRVARLHILRMHREYQFFRTSESVLPAMGGPAHDIHHRDEPDSCCYFVHHVAVE